METENKPLLPWLNHTLAADIIYWSIIVMGCIVLASWAVEWDLGKRIIPGQVSMKAATACSFVLCGVVGLSAVQSIAGTMAATLLLLIVSPWLSALGGGVLQVWEDNGKFTIAPGVPSLGTLAAFLAFAVYHLFRDLHHITFVPLRRAILAIGITAVIGYATGVDSLKWYYKDFSTAMALHTAIGFVLLSVAMALDDKCCLVRD